MTAFWMDDRKLVITSEQRKTMGSDYQHTYNIPCKNVRGRIKPLYTCQHCKGSGDEPEAEYDRCDVCRGSGGMPAAATEKGQP